MTKLLTIGMATYDDYDGTYFSTQALCLYHDILKNIDYEIVLIDNNPDSPHGQAVKNLTNWMDGKGKYIAFKDKQSTSVRNEIFKNATGKYTVSMDCHVFLAPGSIESLLEYYSANPDCKDIVQGPMLYDDHKNYSTQFDPVWRGDMYGIWGTNKEACELGEPFEIPMMGLGVFSCETKNWLGFNENFKGFGGEEGYIHEKFRKNGGKAICLPKFKWTNRFNRPNGVKYRLWQRKAPGYISISRLPPQKESHFLLKYGGLENLNRLKLFSVFPAIKTVKTGYNYLNS